MRKALERRILRCKLDSLHGLEARICRRALVRTRGIIRISHVRYITSEKSSIRLWASGRSPKEINLSKLISGSWEAVSSYEIILYGPQTVRDTWILVNVLPALTKNDLKDLG